MHGLYLLNVSVMFCFRGGEIIWGESTIQVSSGPSDIGILSNLKIQKGDIQWLRFSDTVLIVGSLDHPMVMY